MDIEIRHLGAGDEKAVLAASALLIARPTRSSLGGSSLSAPITCSSPTTRWAWRSASSQVWKRSTPTSRNVPLRAQRRRPQRAAAASGDRSLRHSPLWPDSAGVTACGPAPNATTARRWPPTARPGARQRHPQWSLNGPSRPEVLRAPTLVHRAPEYPGPPSGRRTQLRRRTATRPPGRTTARNVEDALATTRVKRRDRDLRPARVQPPCPHEQPTPHASTTP